MFKVSVMKEKNMIVNNKIINNRSPCDQPPFSILKKYLNPGSPTIKLCTHLPCLFIGVTVIFLAFAQKDTLELHLPPMSSPLQV